MQYEHGELLGAAKQYIDLMKESGLGYFRIKNDKFEIELGEKQPPMTPPPPVSPMQFAGQQQMPPFPPIPPQPGQNEPKPSCEPQSGKVMNSPIVGTFYAAPSPEKAPYVTIGKQVSKGDVLFIIESMKLMNEVTSEFDGVVADIYVEDGETVEFGQPVMRIE